MTTLRDYELTALKSVRYYPQTAEVIGLVAGEDLCEMSLVERKDRLYYITDAGREALKEAGDE